MNTNIITFKGEGIVGECELNQDVFACPYRPDILSMVVRWQLAKRRSGCHASKGISDISGTTRKPYKQKGTGRARQGSLRSPQFRGGAVIFGPVVRSHAFSLNKKIRSMGLKVALSFKCAKASLLCMDDSVFESKKTKDFVNWFVANQQLKECKSALFVLDCEGFESVRSVVSNLFHVNVIKPEGLNVYDVLRHERVIISQSALKVLLSRFGV